MQRDYKAITIMSAVTPVAVTSSTDATPIVVTATAHLLKQGQRVLIYGHTTNIAANGIFIVGAVTSNTFGLKSETDGSDVAGSGAGAGGGGICMLAPTVVNIKDYRNVVLQVGTSGTATTTVKVAGSVGKPMGTLPSSAQDCVMPNFGATVSPTNPYSFLQIINLDTAAAVNGATGIVVSGTDVNNLYEININVLPYLTIVPVTWAQGAITATLFVANNI